MTRFEKSACGLALAGGLAVPFLLDGYTIRVAAMALYYVILASSWNLLLGYAGQLSFAHAAFAGIGAYTSGLLSHHHGVHPGIGIFIGGAVAAGIGWCLGRMCLRTRGPYLALMTLGFSETVRLILQIEHDYTRGSLGLRIPYLFGEGQPHHVPGYFVMLALAVLTVVVLHRLVNSEKGLYFKAIREDEDVAAVMGVELVKWKVNAFMISSLFAGLAGAVYAHLFVQVLAPQNLLLIEMGLILAMTIVGGLGTLTGPIIGAILLVVVWEVMRDVSPYAHMLLFATLVIVVMKFFRAGVFGLIAGKLKAKGLMAKAPPLTVEQGPDRPAAPSGRCSRHVGGEDPPRLP